MSLPVLAAAWLAVSVPASLAVGRLLRRTADRYPTVLSIGGVTVSVRPMPLSRRELQKIINLFDPGALVLAEPVGGYVEVAFPDPDDAVAFVGMARDGRHGNAATFVENVVTVARVSIGEACGPVTLGVTLAPAWRPAGEVAA